MKKYYRFYFKLESDLFIGSGDVIRKHQMFLQNGKYHVIDEIKLVDLVLKRNLWSGFELYLNRICNPSLPHYEKDLLRWLESERFTTEEKLAITKYAVEDKTGDSRINEIKAFVKNSYGHCFIPGSSVKGYIHTCLIAQRIKANSSELNFVRSNLKSSDRNLKLSPSFLQDLKKTMAGITVADSSAIDSKNLVIGRVKYCNIKNNNPSLTRIPVNIEFLRRGTTYTAVIGIDESIIKLNELLSAIREYNLLYHQHFVSKFSGKYRIQAPANQEVLRLGAFTNFALKTINYAILGSEAVDNNSRILQEAFRNSKNIQGKQYGVSPMCLKASDTNGTLSENGIISFHYEELKIV